MRVGILGSGLIGGKAWGNLQGEPDMKCYSATRAVEVWSEVPLLD